MNTEIARLRLALERAGEGLSAISFMYASAGGMWVEKVHPVQMRRRAREEHELALAALSVARCDHDNTGSEEEEVEWLMSALKHAGTCLGDIAEKVHRDAIHSRAWKEYGVVRFAVTASPEARRNYKTTPVAVAG